MKNRINENKTNLFIMFLFLLGITFIVKGYCLYLNDNTKYYNYSKDAKTYLSNTEKSYIYVSDLPFMKATSAWKNVLRDTTSSNTPITLKIDNSYFPFEKGIWAHATSTVDIDIREYKDYAYLTTYYGVNQTSNNNGNGVKFYIYTSVDGINWTLRTEENPEALKSSNQAVYVKIDIRDANYIRLYAHDNNANGNDHSVWADTKLVKENYKETNYTKSVSEYDQIIKENYSNAEIKGDYEKILLQREFVRSVGQYTINAFAKESEKNRTTLNWLLNDDNGENLKLYLMGGTPDGSYFKSLNVLSELYNKYKDDFKITNKTKYGTVYGDLYKRMAIALSLTHSATVGLWMDPNVPENQSDAVVRYQIYKDLHKNGKFIVSSRQDHTEWFEKLEIEEMRFVLNNIIDDEEILWLNEYTQKYIDANPGKEEEFLQPHHYMKYIWPDYSKPEYYAEENKKMWSEKYGNFLDYGITYKQGVPKLWMNIDNGAVCGGISKIGSNIRGVHGTPSSVISQPGHAALIYYRENADGQGYWTIDNDVSGWAQSGRTERLSLRMPLGWGDEEYIDYDKDWLGLATYVLLAQGALNDFDNYQSSKEIYMQADVYKDDLEKLYKIYRQALEKEPINIDAWYGLIKTYRQDKNKTDKDYYELAEEILDSLKYYPLPAYHLVREIQKDISSNEYSFVLSLAQTRALNEAKDVTSKESIQQQAVKQEANYLLGIFETELATFSFDGDDAGKIALTSRYDGTGVRWNYSLDGKKTWKSVSFTADEEHKYPLTKEEIASITAENDIYIHIEGVSYDDENLYKIDIEKANTPDNWYANDLENRVIGVNTHTQWRMNAQDDWKSYMELSPDLSGNQTVELRVGANGIYLPSESLKFTFTNDNQPETEKYIPISHLSVEAFSTEAAGHDRYAKYTIDGNLNTSWHSDWNGNDHDKFIVLKLDQAFYLSALEYVPRLGSSLNGRVKNAKIEISMDGENWTTVVKSTKWSTDTSIKKVTFSPVEALYIRFTGVETYGNFITAAMFNLYQDTTKEVSPTSGVAYSITSSTNQDVIARLVNPSTDITVTNNNGSTEYVFKENGTFTFEFKDSKGNIGKSIAKVDWIDKKLPTANVEYNIKNKTNQEVMAKITFSEKVKLLNEGLRLEESGDGVHTLTFEDNDELLLKFIDEAGNIGTANIKVSWIDKVIPTAQLVYSATDPSYDPVTVTLVPSENVKILNNNGSMKYTFTKNGTFTFEYQDEAGNIGKTTTVVNWILEKQNAEVNSNPSTNSTENNNGNNYNSNNQADTTNNSTNVTNEQKTNYSNNTNKSTSNNTATAKKNSKANVDDINNSNDTSDDNSDISIVNEDSIDHDETINDDTDEISDEYENSTKKTDKNNSSIFIIIALVIATAFGGIIVFIKKLN